MKSISIKWKYPGKCLIIAFLSGLIAIGTIGGCHNDSGGNNNQALTENDFADNGSLKGDPQGGVIVTFLEHPDSEIPEKDTGETGTDEIPLRYKKTIEHTLCWEDEDGEAGHFMELIDSEGNKVLRLDVNGECVTEVIEKGDYVMVLHHDGRNETSYPIFIIPNPEDLEQAKQTGGLINRFEQGVFNTLNRIQNTIYKYAIAQTVQDNVNTLFSTRSCIGCNLSQAFLEGANLARVNLSGADLSFADVENADLSEAILEGASLSEAGGPNVNLSGANLSGVDLSGALLSGANFTGVDLSGANFTGVSMCNANLTGAFCCSAFGPADFTGANLTGSDLSGANLSGANLSGACLLDSTNLSGTNLSFANMTGTQFGFNAEFSGATWCDGVCVCSSDFGGTGACNDCPATPNCPCTNPNPGNCPSTGDCFDCDV